MEDTHPHPDGDGPDIDHDDRTDDDNNGLGNFGQVHLGAKQPARNINDIDSNCESDPFHPTFPGFAQKLSRYLNNEYKNLGIQRPGNRTIVVDSHDMVSASGQPDND